MRYRFFGLAAVGIVIGGVVVAGCTGSDSSPAHKSATTKALRASVLHKAWSADPGLLWDSPPNTTTPWAWTTSTSIVVAQRNAMTAYSSTTGKQLWTVPLGGSICTIAPSVNAAGIGAVLTGSGSFACGTTAIAIDTTTGKMVWKKSLHASGSTYHFSDIVAGDSAVTATNPCDSAISLSIRTGSEQALLPRTGGGDGCEHAFASDGHTIVDGSRAAGHEALTGYDSASGRKLWTVPLHPEFGEHAANPEVDRVISSNPVIIDARISNHRFFERVDPGTHTFTRFGRQSSDSYVPTFTQVIGSNLVVQYGQSDVLFAYDTKTGAQTGRTVLAANESAVGVRDGKVITVAAGGGAAFSKAGLVARSTDPVTGARQLLGTSSIDGVAATFGRGVGFEDSVVGDTLVLSTQHGVVGYPLPASGPDSAKFADGIAWKASDIRPDKVADICAAITPATKRAIGFPDPNLSAPGNCQWAEEVGPIDVRQLFVSADAVEPAGRKSAVAVAHARIAQVDKPDSVNHLPAPTPVTGIGDEAYIVSSAVRSTTARLVARKANVVVIIYGFSEEKKALPSLRRGVRDAANDVLRELARRLR